MLGSFMEVLELFPDAAYRHRMRFQPGSIAGFFGRTAQHHTLVRQRREWIERDASACVQALPEGGALVDETIDLLLSHSVLAPSFPQRATTDLAGKTAALGGALEPDLLLLSRDAAGTFRLKAGCVCFPSSWSLAEKMGQPLEQIHGIVPGLNEQLGRAIQSFLTRLTPGEVSLRGNWGLSRSAELNQHPSRRLPRLDATVEPGEVWLRVEHQALTRLPESGGVLFGIRISTQSLSDLSADAELRCRLRLALETMPAAMAEYKGLTEARSRIIEFLA